MRGEGEAGGQWQFQGDRGGLEILFSTPTRDHRSTGLDRELRLYSWADLGLNPGSGPPQLRNLAQVALSASIGSRLKAPPQSLVLSRTRPHSFIDSFIHSADVY